ncbi:NnrS family protein [Aliisedimentitalea scapharcae]|uniref:NnrS family protein n=1 Tax=Aliisedimentitalea scapharcae TaxID=1524259 RepID=A0ABZ2XN80_9RHOB
MMATVNRVFSEGFRVFFLAAGIYGIFTGLVWTLWLGGVIDTPSQAFAPHLWHAHEMIFGYATAAIGGFFLTAVPNWTNAPGARQGYIAVVSGLWFAGRLAVWYSAALPPLAVAGLDLIFVPILAAKILSQLLKRPKPQNMMFMIFLALLWVSNLMVHLEWIGVTDDTAYAGMRGGVIVLCSLIAILGGRVTPAFTRNAMKRDGVPEARWPRSVPVIERATIVLAILLPVLVLAQVPGVFSGAIAIVFGVVQLIRLSKWGGGWCLKQPILLALHMGLAMLALGLILWGLAGLQIGDEIAALHVLGIGCVGGMTLAVMSRAGLGHSGRPLIAPTPIALGYFVIALAAAMRWVGPMLSDSLFLPSMMITGFLWVLAFALYVVAMWPALTQPRLGSMS